MDPVAVVIIVVGLLMGIAICALIWIMLKPDKRPLRDKKDRR